MVVSAIVAELLVDGDGSGVSVGVISLGEQARTIPRMRIVRKDNFLIPLALFSFIDHFAILYTKFIRNRFEKFIFSFVFWILLLFPGSSRVTERAGNYERRPV